MTSEELKKHLSRKLTVMFIPHSNIRPIRLNLSIALLIMLALSWSGLTVWSGYIASRHVDYWRGRADEQMMRLKVWYYAEQVKKSREYLDQVREREIALENLLNMKTRKAIVSSDNAVGGPSRADEKQLAQLLNPQSTNLNLEDIKEQFEDMQRSGDGVLNDFQEISQYIRDQHDLYRATPMNWPTVGRITSFFGVRKSPLDGSDEEFHRGIDIASDNGTPIHATADGVVRLASWEGGYGRLVILDHGHGYRTYYAHNSEILVKVGQQVRRGQVISLMGTSGMSTGYHLHYEVWHNGQVLNPMKFVKVDAADQTQ